MSKKRRIKPSAFQTTIHKLQLELFRANQKLINEAVEGYTDEYRRYETCYRRTVRDVRGPATFGTLIRHTKEARVILIGDYHTLDQAQRTFYRILRKQRVSDDAIVVALEMLAGDHQADIDRFLKERTSEKTFLKRIDHGTRWPFGHFEIFHPIFDLSRERDWSMMGIDLVDPSEASLEERDLFAAERIAQRLAEDPELRIFVLVGEMHLAPSHLPRAIAKAMKEEGVEGEILRIHQNSERIWFDQAEQGIPDEHDVLQLKDGSFVILTTSPLICQQSFLTWLDLYQDGDLEEADPFEIDAGERVFQQSMRILGRSLGLPTRNLLQQVEIVGPADLSFFERLERSGSFSKRELKQIKTHILASESYYIPRAQLVYLATLSINHVAEEAAHFLRHQLSGEGIDDPQGMVDAFYARVLNEAIGFMGSKIVNPKRKGVDLDLIERLAATSAEKPATRSAVRQRKLVSTAGHEAGGLRAIDAEAAKFVIAHKKLESGEYVPWLADVFYSSPELFNAVTHILGYLLGDRLYYGLVRGIISTEEAGQLFYEPLEEDNAASGFYFELAARVRRIKLPDRL